MEGTENGADGSKVKYFSLLWNKFYRGVAIIQITMFNVDVMWQQVSLGQVRVLWMEWCHHCHLDGVDALHLSRNIKMAWSYGERDV